MSDIIQKENKFTPNDQLTRFYLLSFGLIAFMGVNSEGNSSCIDAIRVISTIIQQENEFTQTEELKHRF